MAIDQDGYDNIMDPNTMESLPKLSGFGSGNLSGSNLYIPVYNSITGEYQKVTVADVQPDYAGVKNNLLADAISSQATPQIGPNMLACPNGVIQGYQTDSSYRVIPDNGWMHRYILYPGKFSYWKALQSTGNSSFRERTNNVIVPTGTLCDGVGAMEVLMPKCSAGNHQSGYAVYASPMDVTQARNKYISFSMTAKCANTTNKLCVYVQSVTSPGGTHGADDPVTTWNASGTPPTLETTYYTTLGSTTLTASNASTWQRITLENMLVPAGCRGLRVVIIDCTTIVSATQSDWSISGLYMHLGVKAMVYKSDQAAETFKAKLGIAKSNQDVDIQSGLGYWSTTTNWISHPIEALPIGSGAWGIHANGTVGNGRTTSITTGVTYTWSALSATTTVPAGGFIRYNATTAAAPAAGLLGDVFFTGTVDTNPWVVFDQDALFIAGPA